MNSALIIDDTTDLNAHIDAGDIATEVDTEGEVVSLYMHQEVVFTTTEEGATVTIPE